MTEPEIAIVGAGFGGIGMAIELRKAGFDDFVVLEQADGPEIPDHLRGTVDKFDIRGHIRPHSDAVAFDFDDETDRWHVRTTDGRLFQPRAVVLAPGSLHEPSVPDFPGPDMFRGGSFHFDQHIVGANGLTLQQAWRDGMAGFLGVAVHGFPNLFLIMGPNSGGGKRSIAFMIEAQARYIRRCLDLMRRTSNTRIEVRAATQHEFNRRLPSKHAGTMWNSGARRALRRPDPGHYDLTVPADREPAYEYSGPALLDAPGAEVPVEVTLSGHCDPIDGHYHWYGRLAPGDGGELPDPGRAEVFLTLPGGPPTAGRLQERDPWGNVRIVGIGTPPYPLETVDPVPTR
ncbi:DUF4873 domain-containing protein [Nocardia sp. CA-107356]|uniref:DUF4873 domain-containing protein n=1 Tax=Nocardia sp. CA-107356 TaxID=3239972 RepID=UPI003D89F6C9